VSGPNRALREPPDRRTDRSGSRVAGVSGAQPIRGRRGFFVPPLTESSSTARADQTEMPRTEATSALVVLSRGYGLSGLSIRRSFRDGLHTRAPDGARRPLGPCTRPTLFRRCRRRRDPTLPAGFAGSTARLSAVNWVHRTRCYPERDDGHDQGTPLSEAHA